MVGIYEGKDLQGSALSTSVDSFVEASIVETNEKNTTKIAKGTTNPKYNEQFEFSIPQDNLTFKVEGFVQGILQNSSLGEIVFPLNQMEDMKPRVSYFDFCTNGQPNGNGQLLLKVQYFYNMTKYFEGELNECQDKIYALNDILEKLKICNQNLAEPFGLIYNGKMTLVQSKEFIEKSDEIIDEYEKERTNLFRYKKYAKDQGFNVMNDMNTLGKNIGNMGKMMGKNIGNLGKSIGNLGMTYGQKLSDNVSWSGSIKTFSYLLLILSFLSLIKRKDFVNFGVAVGGWLYYILELYDSIVTFLDRIVKALGFCIGYDLLWLLVQFYGFVIGSTGENEIGLKRFTYIISVVIVVIKVILLNKINTMKSNKKNEQDNLV